MRKMPRKGELNSEANRDLSKDYLWNINYAVISLDGKLFGNLPIFYQNFMKKSPDMDGLCLLPGLNLCPSGKLHGRSSPNTTGLNTIRE